MTLETGSLGEVNRVASVLPSGKIEAKHNNSTKNNHLDPQIKTSSQKTTKRTFNSAYKLQILNAFDACKTSSERGALLRKEGLYYAQLNTWRKRLQNGKFASLKTSKSILLNQQLARENAALKKKLVQAEAIIELQKKVSDLLSIHILDQNTNEGRS